MIRSTSSMDRPVAAAPRPSRRRWYVLAGLALVLAWALPGLARWWRADAVVDRSAVRLGTVTRGDLERDFGAQGQVVAASHPTLFSPAAGLVERLARPGDVVAAGALVARIDSPELASRVRQEVARLAALQADLERARVTTRQQQLLEEQAVDLARVRLETATRGMRRAELTKAEGILNEVQFEAAQDALRIAALELRAAEKTAALAEEGGTVDVRQRAAEVERQRELVAELNRQLAALELRSPVSGQVGSFAVEERDAVVAGQAVVSVVDLSAFEVEIQVPEGYARELAPGDPAEVTANGRVHAASVHAVSPEVVSGQVRCTLAFAPGEEPAALRQSQRVTVRLVFETRPGVLKVPRGPFLEAGGGRLAWVVNGGEARPRPITIGATSVSEVEVTSGLEEGEVILLTDMSRYADAESVLVSER
jgi:HlyD family secretion protein